MNENCFSFCYLSLLKWMIFSVPWTNLHVCKTLRKKCVGASHTQSPIFREVESWTCHLARWCMSRSKRPSFLNAVLFLFLKRMTLQFSVCTLAFSTPSSALNLFLTSADISRGANADIFQFKVTANSGQGACMAIEDAFVLGLLLRRYWGWVREEDVEYN